MTVVSAPTTSPIARAVRFIRLHATEPLTLDRIARASGHSPFHFALRPAPCLEIYVNGGQSVPDSERLTDLCVPVE